MISATGNCSKPVQPVSTGLAAELPPPILPAVGCPNSMYPTCGKIVCFGIDHTIGI